MNKQSLYGLVVCGGKSTRMGKDKAFIRYRQKPQLYQVHDLLRPFCAEVFISCSNDQALLIDKQFQILPDDEAYKNTGPAAALLTAVKNYPEKDFLLIGCDYPYLTTEELSRFMNTMEKEKTAAFYNTEANKYEPMLGYYPGKAAQLFLRTNQDEQISLQHFLKQHNAQKYVPTKTLFIKSIDTPQQEREAKELLSEVRKVTTSKFLGETSTTEEDLLVVEEPLEIVVQYQLNGPATQKTISITMRTPGNDAELAAGFLFTEGIIQDKAQVKLVIPEANGPNSALVILHDHVDPLLSTAQRNFYTTSSCGVCGKASIEAIRTVSVFKDEKDALTIDKNLIYRLPDMVRDKQAIFESTGGLHAAALFEVSGNFIQLAEDVGRHNALDKLIGRCFLDGLLPLSTKILFLSGRASFELVQKAYMAGIKIIAAVGAPSSLAVELAEANNITLIGFLRQKKFNVYAGKERVGET